MQHSTQRTFLTRVAMALLLSMMSMMVTAQTLVVVDKNGKKTTYDVSKIDSVTFQNATPGFTLHEQEATSAEGQTSVTGKSTQYNFADVQNVSGDNEYIFADLDTIYVDGEGQDFEFKVRSSVNYNYKVSEGWLEYGSKDAETGVFKFSASKNPSTNQRKGYVALVSSDEQRSDTVWVVQTRKLDSRYIDIDWAKATLNSFSEETGQASITFTGDVPVMGDYDVVLLPKDGDYMIRVIDDVQQTAGSKTVTLATRQGVMGNLFKGTKFNLATQRTANTRGSYDDVRTYLPTKVEVFTGEEYVEIYNADKPLRGGTRAPQGFENEFINWEYNDDGRLLWDGGAKGTLSWDKLNFNIGLKGLFSFDFGDVEWEKVRMGDLQHLKIALEGGFNMELVMKYLVSSSVEWQKEWTLKEDVFKAKYTFMVGTVPVYISVGADLMAEVSLGASGEASITGGIQASNTVTYGVEWDAQEGVSKIAECNKSLEIVGPDIDINAHAEARATAYPKIKIGIYKVLCPTISPQPYLKAEADGRLVDNSMVAWNAGINTGIDLGLGLCLDLFFWKKDLGEFDPINVFDQPLVSLPDEIELQNEKKEQMLINGQKEVKYHVTNKNYLTGTEYNASHVLVHFEAEGGEISSEYDYTDAQGNVSVRYTPTAGEKGGVVKAEVVLGAEPEKPEDAMKADDYSIEAIDYRLTGGSYTIPEGETSVKVTFQLDRYSSTSATWAGAAGRTVSFTATNGTVSPASGVTDASGKVTVTFTAGNNFSQGSVTASANGSDPSAWSKTGSATVKGAGSGGGVDDITDDDLKKAKSKGENVYVIEDKNGKTEDFSYSQEWSDWTVNEDGAVSFQLENADENGSTLGGFWGSIPLSLVGSNTAITQEFLQQNSGFYVNFGHYISTETSNGFDAYVMSKGGEIGGNIKTDGSSKFLLREVKSQQGNTRGNPDFAGEYEFIYYLVFTSESDDYIVYGNGIINKHVPTVSRFELSADKDWVKVGGTTKVTLESYYEKEATWDWSDVELVGQSTSYNGADNENLGFFTWDASTQTLTSVKSNNNKDVYLKFALKDKPGVKEYISVKTGDGWNYTTITPSVSELKYTGYGYMSFSIDFTPKASDTEKFDYNALEIDPETNPNGYFSIPMSYASQGWPLYVNNAPKGEYNVRLRIKSNHDVNCTVKIISEYEE